MPKLKVFISSVQSEFAYERSELYEYIMSDALLGRYFEPFLFEKLPATDLNVSSVYLREVEQSAVYIGLFGREYGYEDSEGISPTEREFDHASLYHKTRFAFITNNLPSERHEKENAFIQKVESVLVRKMFCSTEELKVGVYTSLINYLLDKEVIRSVPFDASTNNGAVIADIDAEKIQSFVRLAKSKRGFPLPETASVEEVLTHLNLSNDGRLSNASLLLFGKQPQRFFINSSVRCASFYGNIVEKPIPSYKVFNGNLFELVDQTIEFVLSKLDYAIGTRAENISIPGSYEIPKEIVAEAIVNAIVHRDYTSNGSVQVMLFRDRLEIWNPGTLPMGWTTEKLKQLHRSMPANPLIADPLYLAGYIEGLGTGTMDILRLAKAAGLPEPKFIENDEFRTIIYRKNYTGQVSGQVSGQPTGQLTGQVTPQVGEEITIEIKKIIVLLETELKRGEMMDVLQLNHREYFVINYLAPALELGIIELKYPEIPNHPDQKYKLTEKGVELRRKLVPKTSKNLEVTHQVTPQVTHQVTPQVTPQVEGEITAEVKRLVSLLVGEMGSAELQVKLELSDRKYFRSNYLRRAIDVGLVEMTVPDKPNSKMQKYRLTSKGKALRLKMKRK